MKVANSFEKALVRLSKVFETPFKVQTLIKSLEYSSRPDSMKSAKKVWETKKLHCLESVHLAAAILEKRGYPPLALSLDSADGICHVVFVFRDSNGWGSVGRSREVGLQGRAPIFRSIRDLAWSYFNPYVDDTGRLTGYAFYNLDESGCDWRYSNRNVWASERYALNLKHKQLYGPRKFEAATKAYLNGGHDIQPTWW